MMHDVGKIGISREILTKKGKLNAEEFEVIRNHPVIGANILRNPENRILEMAHEIALYHHEKWNGKGYPKGLAEKKIPKAARIAAIADVFDALLSGRSYKSPFQLEKVRKIFEEEKAKHFDHDIVNLLLKNFDTFTKIFEDINSMKGEDISNNLFGAKT